MLYTCWETCCHKKSMCCSVLQTVSTENGTCQKNIYRKWYKKQSIGNSTSNSTENETFPKITKSRNWDALASRVYFNWRFRLNWKLYRAIWECFDLVDFGGVAFSVISVIAKKHDVHIMCKYVFSNCTCIHVICRVYMCCVHVGVDI